MQEDQRGVIVWTGRREGPKRGGKDDRRSVEMDLLSLVDGSRRAKSTNQKEDLVEHEHQFSEGGNQNETWGWREGRCEGGGRVGGGSGLNNRLGRVRAKEGPRTSGNGQIVIERFANGVTQLE